MMRRLLAVAAAAAISWNLMAASADAATTNIGAVDQISANQAPDPLTVNGFTIQTATTGGNSYAVPAGYGVITQLRHRTGTTSGTLTFKVYRPTGTAGTFLVVAAESRQVTAGTNHTFDVRIPVKPGDVLGLSSDSGVQEAYDGVGPETVNSFSSDPPVGEIVPASGPSLCCYLLDVAAVVETDADGDGYGDDTQDSCSTDARTTGKCANTTITKKPKNKVRTAGHKAHVKIKFTGADPSGTFRCSIDAKAFKACKSPFEKRFGPGKHKVAIEAVNAQGVVELTPEVVKFTVARKH